jgi:hypothetical protein
MLRQQACDRNILNTHLNCFSKRGFGIGLTEIARRSADEMSDERRTGTRGCAGKEFADDERERLEM